MTIHKMNATALVRPEVTHPTLSLSFVVKVVWQLVWYGTLHFSSMQGGKQGGSGGTRPTARCPVTTGTHTSYHYAQLRR